LTGYATLRVERRGPVGWLTFDRPEAGNAMDATMLAELETAWAELEADPEVRVIVTTGAGQAFQTGLDVVQLSRDREALREQSRRTKRADLRLTGWHCGVTKPVIAAVNGVCAGGGLHFVADADIVVLAEGAELLDPHVSIGQVSAYETIGLARKAPMEATLRMALVGRHERISAARAVELGIASQVVDPPDQLEAVVQDLAETIAAAHPPEVHAATKAALWGALEEPAAPRPRLRDRPGPSDPKTPRETMTTSYETLLVERHGPVGWIINNRPDQLNAMNNRMRDELGWAWRELDEDPAVRVIVHTGAGRAFQTGVDVNEIATDGGGMGRYRRSMEDFDLHFTSWHQGVWKPVITAVNGICAGGGFHWVADADIVIAGSDAQFFDPHVSIGQVVSLEAIGLMRKMPVEAVMRMAFVGRYERMSAQRAYELGMISEIVDPPDRLREVAQELAEKIAKNSPSAMAATKRALWGALEMGLTDACKAGARELVSMWGHPDQVEGPQAFAEKRPADWAPIEAPADPPEGQDA
jgi:enoyl-CoA hydratase/carnithine racemase